MDRVSKILNNKTYNTHLLRIEECEKDRVFCNHTLEHFLTVSRIAYIKVLEEQLNYSKEIVYAIGLLHDIGRDLEYLEGIPHHIASADISGDILRSSNFNDDEINIIIRAIRCHREKGEDSLCNIIYESDKLSRECFKCKAEKQCYWSKEKKNLNIKY